VPRIQRPVGLGETRKARKTGPFVGLGAEAGDPTKNPPGKLEMGFGVPDLHDFFNTMAAKGGAFPLAPKKQEYGGLLAQSLDSEGASVTVNGN
jgi:predicted enzyme related to lactoylglutathione lyase